MDRAQNRNKSPYRPRHQAEPKPRGPLASLSSSAKKNVAAAAVSAALLGAFGVGAFTVAQGDASFDPQAFVSNLGGDDSGDTGYRANPTDADADANRHKDESKDDRQSADASQGNRQDDAFSNADQQAGGAAAYNVTGSGTGASVNVANGGTESSGGTGVGGTVPGLVVEPGASGTAGGEQQGSGGDQPNGGGNGNGGSNTGENNGGNGGGGSTPAPTPSFDPTGNSYKVLESDPTPKKNDPGSGTLVYKDAEKFSGELTGTDPEQCTPTIMYSGTGGSWGNAIYQGQKLDAWTIFCSLVTTFMRGSELYQWTSTKEAFPTYPLFRVDGWTSGEGDDLVQDPELCPDSELTVSVSYRYTADGEWQHQDVKIAPEKSAVFVLGNKTTDGSDRAIVYQSTSTQVNLLQWGIMQGYYTASGYLNDDGSLSHMLLGWTEAGEPADFLYALSPGRHVVEPGGVAEVPQGLTVKSQTYNVTDDYRVANDGANLCALQTLADIDGSLAEDGDALDVPEGVQAVDEEKDDASGRAYRWTLDTMRLPSSTIYVNLDGPFAVEHSFEVDAANPYLASTADGILTNKSGTEYLGIPVAATDLDIPAGVTDVSVPAANSLVQIDVHGTGDEAPSLNADALTDCKIVVDDDAFEDFVTKNYASLENTFNVEVAKASEPDEVYSCSGGMVFSEDELSRVLDHGTDTIYVQMPHTIKSGAFEGCSDVTTVVLYDDTDFTLEEGSLAGGNVQKIVCFTKEQADAVRSRLAAAGAPDAAVYVAGSTDDEDFYYYRGADNEVVLLSYVGWNRKTFDGTLLIDGQDVPVTAIAPYAFAGSDDLEWVDLNASVVEVGASAFEGCNNLQGFFMDAEDGIHVGKNAFAGCSSLGFWGTNARGAVFDSQENPNPDCRWLCPAIPVTNDTGQTTWYFPEGFDPASIRGRFTCISQYEHYCTQPQQDGSLVLYGCLDGETPDLAVGSGTTYNGTLVIPSTVKELFDGSFKGLSGEFTLQWDDSGVDRYIDEGAFSRSGFTGELSLESQDSLIQLGSTSFADCPGLTSVNLSGNKVRVGDYAFSRCPALTSVTIGAQIGGRLGTDVFGDSFQMRELNLTSPNPIELTLVSPGVGSRFNSSWTTEEEAQNLRVNVPAGSEQDYLEAWVYPLVGRTDYQDLYSETMFDIYMDTAVFPDEATVRAQMAQDLLDPENRLRQMMGLETVGASTIITDKTLEVDGYKYAIGDDGGLTLTEADMWAGFDTDGELDLSSIVPDGYDSIGIGKDAFSFCPGLQRLVLGDKVSSIANGAFNGTNGLTVVLPSGHMPRLSGGSEYDGFSFGGDGLALECADEASQQAYLEAWPRQCMGLTDDQTLWNYVTGVYWNAAFGGDVMPGDDGWDEYLSEQVNTPFVTHENYLRGLMGLDPISGIDELAYSYDVTTYDPWEY